MELTAGLVITEVIAGETRREVDSEEKVEGVWEQKMLTQLVLWMVEI